jgi:hypothetical protein
VEAGSALDPEVVAAEARRNAVPKEGAPQREEWMMRATPMAPRAVKSDESEKSGKLEQLAKEISGAHSKDPLSSALVSSRELNPVIRGEEPRLNTQLKTVGDGGRR